MSGKVMTGNSGNFMLLLDPLSEDKAVFTSVRYTSDSEVSCTTVPAECPVLDPVTDQGAIVQFGKHKHSSPAAFVPNKLHNKETGFNLQPLTGSINTNVIYTPSVSVCSTSTVTVIPAVSRQSTDVFAIPVTKQLSNIQCTGSKVNQNMCFMNTDRTLHIPPGSPLIIIPSSKASLSASSNGVAMEANKFVYSSQPQSLLTASSVLQSIAMTESSVPPSFTRVTNSLDKSASQAKPQEKNESCQEKNIQKNNVQIVNESVLDRNIQVIYPSNLNSSNRGISNKVLMPLTGAPNSVTITVPATVSSKLFSSGATTTMSSSNRKTKSVTVSMPSTLSSQPQIKQMTPNIGGSSFVIPSNLVVVSNSNSIVKNQISCIPPVTSFVPPSSGNTIFIASSSQTSTAEQLPIKTCSFKNPIIMKLPSSGSSLLQGETVGDVASKKKLHISESVNVLHSGGANSQEKRVTKSQGNEMPTIKPQEIQALTAKPQAKQTVTAYSGYAAVDSRLKGSEMYSLPLKINNVYSLAKKVANISTCKEQVKEPERLNINNKNKSPLVCSKTLASKTLADSIYPCYPVLEKLSDRQIAHIMSSIAQEKRDKCRRKLRSRNRPSDLDAILERKCSSYCRKRTLNFLCGLGMLNCKKAKCKDVGKTAKVTEKNAEKQPQNNHIQNQSKLVFGNLQSAVPVQNTSSKATSSEKTGVQVNKVVQPELQSKTIPVNSKRVPMQLIVMNNKLFLLPMTGNVSGAPVPRVLAAPPPAMPAPVICNPPTIIPPGQIRSVGVQQRTLNVSAQRNVPSFLNQPITWRPNIQTNASASIPTFRPTFTALPLTTNNVPGPKVYLPQPPAKKVAPGTSRPPIVIRTQTGQSTIVMSEPSKVPLLSQTPASGNIGHIEKETKATGSTPMSSNKGDMQKETETTGKKIDPWKLPWNYDIKSEPVTEGYGDEPSQKSTQVNKNATNHVITVRLPFQKSTSTVPFTPITWVPRTEPSGNVSNIANTVPTFQSSTQASHQSKFAKTGTELVVESSQSSRIQRLKEILREKEQMLKELKRKNAYS